MIMNITKKTLHPSYDEIVNSISLTSNPDNGCFITELKTISAVGKPPIKVPKVVIPLLDSDYSLFKQVSQSFYIKKIQAQVYYIELDEDGLANAMYFMAGKEEYKELKALCQAHGKWAFGWKGE